MTARAEPLAQRLARFALEADVRAMPAGRQRRLAWCLADFLGCVLAGSALPEARSAFVLARLGDVAIPGSARRLSPESAAIAMGTLGSLLQIHDGFSGGGNHPSGCIVPAVWAMRGGREPADLLPAIAVGYEVANQLAAASHPAQTLAGTAPTSTTGAVGAAAALGRLLRLDAVTLAAAISNAAFSAPVAALRGLTEHGSVVPLHGGLAARCAIEAVALAQAGLTAGERVLEGGTDPGLIEVLRGDASTLAPESWAFETLDRVYFKPLPACRHAHPAIEATLRLLADGPLELDAVRHVRVQTYEVATRFGRAPSPSHELYDRLMSITWAVASTLANGGYGVENVMAPARDPRVEALYPCLDVVVDPGFETRYPRAFCARVVATLADGAQRVGECTLQYGSPGAHGAYSPAGSVTPPLDEVGMHAKFVALAGRRLPEPAAAGLIAAIFAGTPPATIPFLEHA